MNDEGRTKKDLIRELTGMRERLAAFEKKDIGDGDADGLYKNSEGLLRLILTLSTNFIILSPDEIDDGINDVLKAIGSFAEVDRSYVFQFDKTGLKMSNTHEWCDEKITSQIRNLQDISADDYPWFCESIKRFEVVHIPNVAELPPEVTAGGRGVLHGNARSIIAVPIISGYSVMGFLGFDCVSSKKGWSEDAISLLKIVGEIFAYALSRKQVTEALHESESKFKALFEHANDAIFLLKDDIFIDCNTKTLEIFGCTRDKIIGQTPHRFSPPLQPDGRGSKEKIIEKTYAAVKGEQQYFEWKHCRYDGTPFDAEVGLNRIILGGETYLQAIVRDVTERKTAEELFRTLADNSPVSVYIAQGGKFKFVNPHFQQSTGYSEGELLGKDSLLLVIDEEKESVKDVASKMLRGERRSAFELKVSTKTGEIRWIFGTVTPIRYKGNKAVLGNFLDMTDYKKTEIMLKESEERYRTLTEKSLVGVYLVQDRIFRYVNPAFAHIHGHEPEEMIGKTGPIDFIVPEDHDKLEESIRRRKDGENTLVETRIIRTDGTIRNVEVYGSRAIYNGRPAELGTLLDVTEKKELEAKLQTMSMADELTNLYNRRGFFTVSEQQLKMANRINREILCFFIDLDRMKWINDTLGHKEGDNALIGAANILRETFREADVIGRIGGDEFAVLAVGTNEISVEVLMERLQKHVDNYNAQEERPYKLSLSIGVTCCSFLHQQSIDELMSAADALMYEKKKEKYLLQGSADNSQKPYVGTRKA